MKLLSSSGLQTNSLAHILQIQKFPKAYQNRAKILVVIVHDLPHTYTLSPSVLQGKSCAIPDPYPKDKSPTSLKY